MQPQAGIQEAKWLQPQLEPGIWFSAPRVAGAQ